MIPQFLSDTLAATEAIVSRQIFFVVGCQKSGTTWLQNLLNGHDEIASSGEGHFTDRLLPVLAHAFQTYNGEPCVKKELDNDDLRSALRTIIDRRLMATLSTSEAPAGVRFIGDKTPEAAVAVGALRDLYPSARIIQIVRDGRDGVVSGWAHLERSGAQGKFASLAEYAASFADRHWTSYILAARNAMRAAPEHYCEVRYESLHTEPEPTTRRLLEFLGADASDESVRRCIEAGDFKRLSGGRDRGDEVRTSHFRKGIIGDWREAMGVEAVERFEAIAGPLMDELGYARGLATS